MEMKDDVAGYDPQFAEAMKPNDVDLMVGGFVRWVIEAKLGGGPAPTTKAILIPERAWMSMREAAKQEGDDVPVDEWKLTPVWLFYAFGTSSLTVHARTREQRIGNLARILPDFEQHVIEGLADFDAIFFVQEALSVIPTDALVEMCLYMLERWHNKLGSYVPHAQEWKQEYLSHLREVAKGRERPNLPG